MDAAAVYKKTPYTCETQNRRQFMRDTLRARLEETDVVIVSDADEVIRADILEGLVDWTLPTTNACQHVRLEVFVPLEGSQNKTSGWATSTGVSNGRRDDGGLERRSLRGSNDQMAGNS